MTQPSFNTECIKPTLKRQVAKTFLMTNLWCTYNVCLEKGSNKLVVTIYTLFIHRSVHNQRIRTLFEAHIVASWGRGVIDKDQEIRDISSVSMIRTHTQFFSLKKNIHLKFWTYIMH